MRVLVIDDNPTVPEDLGVLLPSHIEVEWAPGTAEAIALLVRHPLPAAIILDLCLPPLLADSSDREGLELLSILRQDLAVDVPVFVLSAFPRGRVERPCLARGAAAYFEKPCRIDELVRSLTELGRPRT